MSHSLKTRLTIFVFALTLALTGLVAQSHSAYAGMNPPMRPIHYSESTTIVLNPADMATAPQGISTSPGRP